GTVAGFAAGDGIDLENFAYSAGGVTVSGISGTGAAGTDTMVTVKDGSQTATLALGTAQSFAGTVAGFAAGDGIDLENFAYSASGALRLGSRRVR
ncbi:MAG TPA: hypothetical protein VE397_07400, partial [Stellaceae bacterium]|nr:hypothetical protein [Stellaceae bacterium]